MALLEKAKLFCWCGMSLNDLSCGGCSSPPFICECSDGSTMRVSQQFSKLPRLVQDSLRSFDLSRVWQKTPAELTAEERVYFGARSMSQPLNLATQTPTSNLIPVPGTQEPAQTKRLFPNPIVQVVDLKISASLGGPIDLKKIAKAFPTPEFNPKRDSFPFPRKGNRGPAVYISSSGTMSCMFAHSEAEVRTAIGDVVGQLRRAGITIHGEPVVQVEEMTIDVFLGRGIAIHSLPERVPDSMYYRGIPEEGVPGETNVRGLRIEGKYNKAGQIISLKSQDDLARAGSELMGGVKAPLTFKPTIRHNGFCRVGKLPVVAYMVRDPDVDGNMEMTGWVHLYGVKSDVAVHEATHSLDKLLEEAGLLGPLTPREKLRGLDEDPGAFDYGYADDPDA